MVVKMAYRYLRAPGSQPGKRLQDTGRRPRLHNTSGWNPGPPPTAIGNGRGAVVVALFQPEHYTYIGWQFGIVNERIVVLEVVFHMISYCAVDGGLAAAEHAR